jgi:L-threonylcarbamoyladenylate synthase
MILAAGRTELGLESTILDLSGDRAVLLRPGAVTEDDIVRAIGPLESSAGNPDRPNAPGQLRRHYAPATPLRLWADDPRPGEAFLAFGPPPLGAIAAARILNLSEAGDLTEAAANLFAMLRLLDSGDYAGIAVMPIPLAGLGAAINDRLARAAAPYGDET